MLVPTVTLAAACVAIGLVPALVLVPARLVVAGVMPPSVGALDPYGEWVSVAGRLSALALGLILITGALIALRSLMDRSGQARTADTWACAGLPLTPRMQYSASSYAAPLLTAFEPLAGVRQAREATAFHSHPLDLVQDGAALPTWRALENLSRRLRGWQGARIRWYLLSVVATLLMLLYRLMQWRGAP